MSPLEILFWLLLLLLLYAYVGYGLLIAAAVRLGLARKGSSANKTSPVPTPRLTFIIMAYNEEEVMMDKLRNTLALDYPKDSWSIMVNADGSTDRTVGIATGFQGVRVLHVAERKGKAAAMNRSVELAGDAEWLVFSDANTVLRPDALWQLVQGMDDERVGAVSGEKQVWAGNNAETQAVGESAYWKYESLMKTWDAKFHTLVGAAGELLALRRNLYTPIPDQTVLDDLFLSLHVCRQGYRVAYMPGAVCMEGPSASLREEWTRKVRIAAGAFQALTMFSGMLWPWPDPRLSFQFFSRRLLRWVACPLALPLVLALHIALALTPGPRQHLYSALLVLHLLCYLLALVGLVLPRDRTKAIPVLQLPLYFLFMHYSLWAGWFRWVSGKQAPAWEKARRATPSI